MTSKQAATLRRLKAIENKAYAAAVIARGFSTSADALAALGTDATYTAWVKASNAVETYFATIRR